MLSGLKNKIKINKSFIKWSGKRTGLKMNEKAADVQRKTLKKDLRSLENDC